MKWVSPQMGTCHNTHVWYSVFAKSMFSWKKLKEKKRGKKKQKKSCHCARAAFSGVGATATKSLDDLQKHVAIHQLVLWRGKMKVEHDVLISCTSDTTQENSARTNHTVHSHNSLALWPVPMRPLSHLAIELTPTVHKGRWYRNTNTQEKCIR